MLESFCILYESQRKTVYKLIFYSAATSVFCLFVCLFFFFFQISMPLCSFAIDRAPDRLFLCVFVFVLFCFVLFVCLFVCWVVCLFVLFCFVLFVCLFFSLSAESIHRFDDLIMFVWSQGLTFHFAAESHPVQETLGVTKQFYGAKFQS